MKPVFADTFYWVSLTNPDDEAHARASAYDLSDDRPDIITTDEVLTEFLTFFSDKGSYWRMRAVAVAQGIRSDETVQVIPQTHQSFRSGFDLYAARPDKGYSLTDCIAMQAMRREGITDVLTNDHHFAQEGFRVLFRANL